MDPAHPCEWLSSWFDSNRALAGNPLREQEVRNWVALGKALPFRGDSYYAELRLQAGTQLDLLLSISKNNVTASHLSSWLTSRAQAGRHAASFVKLRDFVEQWQRPGHPLNGTVPAIWLELDDAVDDIDGAVPSISVCLVPNYGRSYRGPSPTGAQTGASLDEVYTSLAGSACDADTRATLKAVAQALPEGGDLIHLSLMTGRPSCATKLYGSVTTSTLPDFLRRIAWRGPSESVGLLLSELGTPALSGDRVYFDLDLSNLHDPQRCTLGLAFSQQQIAADVDPDIARHGLLTALAKLGHCSVEQAQALKHWPRGAALCRVAGYTRRVRRWLDVKLVLSASGSCQAKGYLGFATSNNPFVIGN